MYFLGTTRFREIERLMQEVPHFPTKIYGKVVLRKEMCVCIDQSLMSYSELLLAAMHPIRYPPFQERLDLYIKESEEKSLLYKNEKHCAVFQNTIRKMNKGNYPLIAAVYLLTADYKLWQIMRYYTQKNEIWFDAVRLRGVHENGYILFCVAKDLYLGTKHLTVGDLANSSLIGTRQFELICNAMVIRKFGLRGLVRKELW